MSASSGVTLYVIPASHSACTAQRMLEHKGIEHRVVRLLSGFHPLLLRLHGFRGRTVPALRAGAMRVQGTLRISRALDELQPVPALFPSDPISRRRVEEAESWGEAVLQPIPRRLYRWALVRDPRVRRELAGLNRLPLRDLSASVMKPLASWFARDSGADDDTVRADLARLPGVLDEIDAWIREGRIGGQPNAADFQIAASVRMLLTFDDLRDRITGRPAGNHALRLVPSYPSRVPPVFPAEWLAAPFAGRRPGSHDGDEPSGGG